MTRLPSLRLLLLPTLTFFLPLPGAETAKNANIS